VPALLPVPAPLHLPLPPGHPHADGPEELVPRSEPEAVFQARMEAYASERGWSYMHLIPVPSRVGWRTPYAGTLGKGWPDLFMVRGDRAVAAELKRDKAAKKATKEDQKRVLSLLGLAGVETYLWCPDDWEEIESVLALASAEAVQGD